MSGRQRSTLYAHLINNFLNRVRVRVSSPWAPAQTHVRSPVSMSACMQVYSSLRLVFVHKKLTERCAHV